MSNDTIEKLVRNCEMLNGEKKTISKIPRVQMRLFLRDDINDEQGKWLE